MISYFCSSKKQHTRWPRDLSSDVCSSDLDLFINVMNVMGVQLTEVHITRLEAGTFYAELVLSTGEHVDARPSDAIALALRSRCPVLCEEEVLSTAGVVMDAEDEADVVADFQQFLENVEPEDFEP